MTEFYDEHDRFDHYSNPIGKFETAANKDFSDGVGVIGAFVLIASGASMAVDITTKHLEFVPLPYWLRLGLEGVGMVLGLGITATASAIE